MRINYNLSAMLTNTQLLRNERNQQTASERLASGLKINHAKDDPAGMAISNKIDVQVAGLGQASRNSSDGISVIETADSSLNEVTSIIQRMRELAVQAANDTNGVEDRQAIQAEIDSLTEEIDRVSENTEFNKKVLLDGSLSRRAYTNNRKVEVTAIGDGVPTDKYGVSIKNDARQAVITGNTGDTLAYESGKITAQAAGRVTINGEIVTINEGDTAVEVYQKIRDGAERAGVSCIVSAETIDFVNYPYTNGTFEETAGYKPSSGEYNPANDVLVFVSEEYGSAEKLNIKIDNGLLAKSLGLSADKPTNYSEKIQGAQSKITGGIGDNSFLKDMTVITLSKDDASQKVYFEQYPELEDMVLPAMVNGVPMDLSDPANKKYATFPDKEDSIPAYLNNSGITVNGVTKYITSGMSAEEVYAQIKSACDAAGVTLSMTDDPDAGKESLIVESYDYSQALVFTGNTENTAVKVECSDARLAKMLGLGHVDVTTEGRDLEAEFTTPSGQRIGYSDSATLVTKGNKITVTDRAGFEIEMEVSNKISGTKYKDLEMSSFWSGQSIKTAGSTKDVVADVTGYGMMTVHVGANEDQIMEVDIPKINAETLGIDKINLRSGYTADKAIAKLDEALLKVNKTRSKLGAYQNRLEHTIASLDAAEEDLTASVSRIRDVDMAKETTEYTQHSILVQAATSVLAQANDMPQQALQLIQ